MTDSFRPHLEILPPPQLRLWNEFDQVPPDFVLYGGTAIALHLGHRKSADFDFFGDCSLDPLQLVPAIPLLKDAVVTQRAPDTLSCVVERGGPVKLSFFGLPSLGRVKSPLIAPANGLRIASLLDLAATKLAAIQNRAETRDYIDLDALFSQGGISLPVALAGAVAVYGPQFNPQISLKALTWFGESSLQHLPGEIRDRLVRAVSRVDLDALPTVYAIRAARSL
jgi:Nucleotidyl transferase AbiEii toxin, Type IV TA system